MYNYDRTASVQGSLEILARDYGGSAVKGSGFSVVVPKNKLDAFLRDARMEYPGISFKKEPCVQLSLTAQELTKFSEGD